jgi:hypothetical protein
LVLRGIEAEGFSVARPLPARLLSASTSLRDLTAGLDDPHLFLAIRHTAALFANYSGITPSSAAAGAFLRRTVTDEDRVVELLDVTSTFPPRRADAPLPVVTNIGLSLLSHPLADRFREFLLAEVATVLIDLPLEPHLGWWLRSSGTTFRYVLLRTEDERRVVPVLVAVVATDEATSHLFLRPCHMQPCASIRPRSRRWTQPASGWSLTLACSTSIRSFFNSASRISLVKRFGLGHWPEAVFLFRFGGTVSHSAPLRGREPDTGLRDTVLRR